MWSCMSAPRSISLLIWYSSVLCSRALLCLPRRLFFGSLLVRSLVICFVSALNALLTSSVVFRIASGDWLNASSIARSCACIAEGNLIEYLTITSFRQFQTVCL